QRAAARPRASAVPAPRLELGDLAVEPPDPCEGEEHRLDLLGSDLAPLGEHDHVVPGTLLAAQLVAGLQQGTERQGNGGQRPTLLDLPRLDAAADLDLLFRRQQGRLADLAKI